MPKYRPVFIDLVGGFAGNHLPSPEQLCESLTECFGLGSAVDFELGSPAVVELDRAGVVTEGDLHDLLEEHVNNTDRVRQIGLVFASALRGFPDYSGLMFDKSYYPLSSTDYRLPREAAAVFVSNLARRRDSIAEFLGAEKPQVWAAMLHRTVRHEFGHIFNLGHDVDEVDGVMAQDTALLQSLVKLPLDERFHAYVKGSAGPCQGHARLLIDAYRDDAPPDYRKAIWPGGYKFVGYDCQRHPTEGRANRLTQAPTDLLRLSLSDDRPYHRGEPLVLEMVAHPALRLSGVELEPGNARIRYWIETPLGERRLFGASRIFDYCPVKSTIAPARHNPRLQWDAQGPVFDMPGRYRLYASAAGPYGLEHLSNAVEIQIVPIERDDELHGTLTEPHVGKFLSMGVSRRVSASARRKLDRILRKADTRRGTPVLPYLAYSRAKDLLAKHRSPRRLTPTEALQGDLHGRGVSKNARMALELLDQFVRPESAAFYRLGPSSARTAAALGVLAARTIGDTKQARAWRRFMDRVAAS